LFNAVLFDVCPMAGVGVTARQSAEGKKAYAPIAKDYDMERNGLVDRPARHAFGTFSGSCTLDLKSSLQEKRVPVSRTRKPSKKKNNLAPSSKEARQKIRRWSFVVEVTKDDTVKTFQPPALTIGNMTSACAAADTILKDIASLDQFKDCKVVVNPKAEETVSLTILNQINGLNEQSRLLTFALKRAVTDVVNLLHPEYLENPDISEEGLAKTANEITERLGKYVMEEQQAMRHQQMIDAGIDPDQVLTNELPVEEIPADFQMVPVSETASVEEAPAEQVSTDPFPDGEFGKEAA
jgi:hypothetical protein